VLCLLSVAASDQHLPAYEDFRRVDRMRRMTGQLQTAELLKLTQIDRALVERVAKQGTNDYQLVWGAAELIGNWPTKRALFESALAASGTNLEVALRYACEAAVNHEPATALPLLHAVEKGDTANIVPWFVELNLLLAQGKGMADLKAVPSWAIRYHDYAAEAARARIHPLERRRDEIKGLLTVVGDKIVDVATEPEMVGYFDNVLALGEELAMHHLAEAVQRGHSTP
jgi:hypothetical protein